MEEIDKVSPLELVAQGGRGVLWRNNENITGSASLPQVLCTCRRGREVDLAPFEWELN